MILIKIYIFKNFNFKIIKSSQFFCFFKPEIKNSEPKVRPGGAQYIHIQPLCRAVGAIVRIMAKITLGCEPVVGSLTPSKKRDYRVTNRLQEGKRPIYAVVFNFIDSRYFNVFATVGGNRVLLPFISPTKHIFRFLLCWMLAWNLGFWFWCCLFAVKFLFC